MKTRILLLSSLPLCLLALPAEAYRVTGDASLQTVGAACGGCHSQAALSPPTITIESDGPFEAGGSALFQITVRSNNGGGAGRFAAFAATTTSAGIFVAGTDYNVLGGAVLNNRVRDVTRRAFSSGEYSWTVELTDLRVGNHTLRVGGNDVNGNDANSLDRGAGQTFAFEVVEASADAGPGEDAGGAPPEDGGDGDEDAGADEDAGGGDEDAGNVADAGLAPGDDAGPDAGPGDTPDAGDDDDDGAPDCACDSASGSGALPFGLVGLAALALFRRRPRRM